MRRCESHIRLSGQPLESKPRGMAELSSMCLVNSDSGSLDWPPRWHNISGNLELHRRT